jgi:hypothetical protein
MEANLRPALRISPCFREADTVTSYSGGDTSALPPGWWVPLAIVTAAVAAFVGLAIWVYLSGV